MKITKEQFKNIVKETMIEENEYQEFFKKALEKTGKSIPQMSDEEKKAFFNKIDAAWDGKGEKNEELTGNQHKLDVDGDGEIEASDLAKLRAGKKDESFADPLEGFSNEYKELLKKLQRSNDAYVRKSLIAKMNVIRKTMKLKPLTNESVNEEEIKWNAVENAIINFLKMNTKILDKKVKDRDTDGVKGGLKSIISGLTNAQRNLKLESVNESEIPSGFLNRLNKNKSLKAGDVTTFSNGKHKGKKVKILKDLGNGRFELELVESVNEAQSDDIVKFLKQNFKKFKYAIDDYFDVDEDFKPNDIVKVNNNSSLAGIKGQTDLDSSFSFDEKHIKTGRSGVDKLKIKINGIMVYGLVGPTYGLKYNESVNEVKVGQMVKVVDNPHWEAALGKKGPFKRKVKGIYGDSVFFTDGSNSDMKYIKESVNEALLPADTKVVNAFFDKKSLEGRNLNTDGKVLKTAGIGSQEMYIHTPNGVKMVGKVTGKYAQSLVQYVNKNYKTDLV